MKRLVLLGALIFGSGCVTSYKSQIIKVRRGHAVRLYDTVVGVQNSYSRYTVGHTDRADRDRVLGFFSSIDNTLHCPVEYFDYCILHEYKHLLEKYGLKFPAYEEHFGRRFNNKRRYRR